MMISFTFATSGSDFYMRNSWIIVYTACEKFLDWKGKFKFRCDAGLYCSKEVRKNACAGMIDKCRSSCSKTVTPTIILETQHGADRVACRRHKHVAFDSFRAKWPVIAFGHCSNAKWHLCIKLDCRNVSTLKGSSYIAGALAHMFTFTFGN